MRKKLMMVAFLSLVAAQPPLGAMDIGVNIYGFSYHLNNRRLLYGGLNETNAGLGVNFVFAKAKHALFFVEAGFFEDTFHNTADYISAGFELLPVSFLGFGGHLSQYQTPSTNRGRPFLAVAPLLSIRYKFLAAHLVYLPKYKKYNPYHILGAYFTFYLYQSRAGKTSKATKH